MEPVMDSLRAVWQAARNTGGDAEVARARTVLERGVASFDPATLIAGDVHLRLDGTCGGEETVDRGIIPAVGRVVSMRARHPGIATTVEIVSIAEMVPASEGDVCRASRLQVTPKVVSRRYEIAFYENLPTGSGADAYVEYYVDMSIAPTDDHGDRLALIGLGGQGVKLELPAGVTLDDLRARIDSIRRAPR
jgi:hypothetical protein